jgi:fructose-bisphosphate aldolase class I
VIAIGDGIPSRRCIGANADALARFAALSQEAGMVPIVEPEVLMDGDHSLARCARVTEATQHAVFRALRLQRVSLEGMLLKPNMVLPGKDHEPQSSVEEVAAATVRALRRCVPAAVPGMVFLSGGQTDEAATAHLNAMNAMSGAHPWQLSFSYGRALQAPVLKAWGGKADNAAKAKDALLRRARLNGAARHGRYSADMETEAAVA